MFGKKLPRRFIALAGTAAVAASLAGFAAAGTGAYFTDSQGGGAVTGTFGHVAVTVTGPGTGTDGLQLNFADMLPGAFQTANVQVQNTGTANEDIYLVFDNTNGAWSAINTLGTYGEFVVNGNDYNNLSNAYLQGSPANPGQTNACGDQYPAIAYLPHVNGLGTLTPGQTATFPISFRYTACISNNLYQGQQAFANPLLFAIVATQGGVLPSDPHNGAGTIAPLNLGSYGAYNHQ